MTSMTAIVRRFVSALGLATILLVSSGCGSQGESSSPADVDLETMVGDPTSISDQISDRPMLVSMWAVWCQPCRRELPELQRISDAASGVDVLAVNVGDDPERIIEYLGEMSLDLPVAIDPVGDLLTALDVSTVPATVLFDSRGSVLWSHLGAVTAEQVDEALNEFVPRN